MEAGLMMVITGIGRLLTNVKYGIEDIQIIYQTKPSPRPNNGSGAQHFGIEIQSFSF